MPNWCKNNLKISANGEKVLELLELLKDEKGKMTFQKFMPMPEELEDTTKSVGDEMSKEESDKLIEKYGANNWYDWRYENWGCKWDASESEFYVNDEGGWTVSFLTPWSPPINFVQALSKEFSDMEFAMQYADESGGFPLGEATFTDGDVLYEAPDMDNANLEELSDLVWNEGWVGNWGGTKGGNM